MAAKKATAYVVVGAAAVIRKDDSERYVYRGAVFSADQIDDDNAKHLVAAKLIEAYEAPVDEDPEDLDEGAYKGVSVKDLKAVIEERNAGREDTAKIVPAEPGNRAEIVAALIADDAKQ